MRLERKVKTRHPCIPNVCYRVWPLQYSKERPSGGRMSGEKNAEWKEKWGVRSGIKNFIELEKVI